MFPLSSFRELFTHMEWADSLVWRAVMSSEAARGDENILEKLRHIHRTQQYFLKVWRGETIDFKKSEDGSLEHELALAQAYYAELRPYLDSLAETGLPGEMRMPWANYFARRVGKEQAGSTTLGETFAQVLSHSTYHRGQVNTRLRELGAEPPLVDYIAWLWLERPATQWP